MKIKYLSYFTKVIVLFIVYFITAKLGLKIDPVSGFATLVWLPTGISLAALLIYGNHLWPGIAIGAFLANLASGAPPLVAVGISVGNTLEAVLAVYLLKRFLGFRNGLDRLQDVAGLIIIAAMLSTTISATIGVLSLTLGRIVQPGEFLSTWMAWWVGDLVSDLVFAPLILVWSTKRTFKIKPERIIEGGCIAVILTFLGFVIFGGLFGLNAKNYPLTYLVFPPLIWIALRFSMRKTVTATAILSLIAIWGTVSGRGHFTRETLNASLLLSQSFVGVISITTMTLSAVVAERKRLEKQKDYFISIASHELKTPVTSLKAFCQVLRNKFTKAGDKTSADLLGKMNTQIDKLTILISDLLDVTKIEAGKLQFHEELFNFEDLVEEIIEEMQRTTTKHRIIKQGATKKEIYGDRDRIGQVITNLLSNAIKYSPQSNKVIVKLKSVDDTVTVCVQDFGVGISEETQPHVFERFYREKEEKEKTFPGLGLGLNISSEIIKRQGGTIWFDSKKDKGSTFCFTLPLKKG